MRERIGAGQARDQGVEIGEGKEGRFLVSSLAGRVGAYV